MRIKQNAVVCIGILFAFLIIAIGTATALETPAEEWNKTFGGTSTENTKSVQQTTDGGYILAGPTNSFGAGGHDAWLIKTYANGTEEWNKTFGGTDLDDAESVQQTLDGGYILAGHTVSFGAGSNDAWLIKTYANGTEEWNKTFGGTDLDDDQSVQQIPDGGYILAGSTNSFDAGSNDAWLIKTYANGTEEWNKTFGGTDLDDAESVQQTSDGGYILAGYTVSFGGGGYDAWLIKTYANGTEEWNKTFGGTNTDDAESVQQIPDGGYILAGSTNSFGAGSNDAWLIKTYANGTEEWNKTFGGTSTDDAESVQQTLDGGYILAGSTNSFGAGSNDAWLIKTYANGTEEWNKTFGGTSTDVAESVQQTTDGGYILTGYLYSFGAGDYDAWLIKIEPPTLECQNINIKPDEINTKTKFINAYMELPDSYSVEDIDVSTVTLTNEDLFDSPVYAFGKTKIGDYDKNGVPDLKVKFGVLGLNPVPEGEYICTVEGELVNEQKFKGTDTITIVTKGKKQK
ncbi:hypothetical protein V7O66_02100 [Methanolobus sp. ZRKC3]|uniref:hypothetical protein n=1 Tax=Methanolobus sp. ZRKC3 TaxID=3125786 RepID=UPI00324844C8